MAFSIQSNRFKQKVKPSGEGAANTPLLGARTGPGPQGPPQAPRVLSWSLSAPASPASSSEEHSRRYDGSQGHIIEDEVLLLHWWLLPRPKGERTPWPMS